MKTTLYALVLVVVGLACEPANATNIYQFGSGLRSTLSTVGGLSGSRSSEADAIGGFLDLEYTFLSGSDQARAGISDVLVLDDSPLSVLRARLQFDGERRGADDTPVPNGLGGVDLTDGGTSNAFLVDTLFNDTPSTLDVTIYSNSGNDVATGTLDLTSQLLDPLSATTLSLPFSDFAGPVDFADVGAIVVEVTGQKGSDILLDNLRTGAAQSNPTPPPAPTVAPYVPLAGGALLIDDFTSGGQTFSSTSPPTDAGGSGGSTSALGGTFQQHVTGGVEADPGTVSGLTRLGYNNDAFDNALFLVSDPTQGQFNFISGYDGDAASAFNPAGLGSIDLTGGGENDGFLLGLLFNDVPVDIDVTAYSGAGNAMSTATIALPGLLPEGGSFFLPFNAFSGIDFTNLSALRFSLESGFGQDLLIDYLAAVPESRSVPEPGSFGLLSIGLIGIGLLRHRRRSNNDKPQESGAIS